MSKTVFPLQIAHFQDEYGNLTEHWIREQVMNTDKVVCDVYALRNNNGYNSDEDACLKRCYTRDVHGAAGRINAIGNLLLHRYPQFLLWLYRDNIDLVHAHMGHNGRYMWPLTNILRIPLVTSFYGFDAYQGLHIGSNTHKKYLRLFKHGTLFLVEGSVMKQRLVRIGCHENKIRIHHLGIDLERYSFKERRLSRQVKLLVCGRFVEKKGIPYAIEALAIARSRSTMDIMLTIIGDSNRNGSLTPEKQTILQRIKELGVDNYVTLTGMLSHEEVLQQLQTHHILLAPSINAVDGDAEGGFPVIITEALATGMPVIGSDHCDIPEIVTDTECGFIVPQKDPAKIARRIEEFITHPDLFNRMGRAGRLKVESSYNIHTQNAKLQHIYMEAVNRR